MSESLSEDEVSLSGSVSDEDEQPVKGESLVSLKSDAKAFTKKLNKRGVVYMSRVPPFMKPNKARTIFEEFGEVTRIYLSEEDANIRQRRRTNGGNASKQFTEGWIEFADKKVAKQVAESLNNTAIGGPKSHYYHDDIWNLKYLKNFKWDYLTEKFSYERRVREAKLKAAMMQAKRNNAEFVELVEKSKQQKYVEERKRKRGQQSATGTTAAGEQESGDNIKRKFRQVSSIAVKQGENANKADKKLLSTVFANKK